MTLPPTACATKWITPPPSTQSPIIWETHFTILYPLQSGTFHVDKKLSQNFVCGQKRTNMYPLSTQSPIIRESHFKSASSSLLAEEGIKQCFVFHPFRLSPLVVYMFSLFVWSIRLNVPHCFKYSSTFSLFHIVSTILEKRDPCIFNGRGCSDKSRVGGFLRVICVPSMAHFASVLFNNTPVIE